MVQLMPVSSTNTIPASAVVRRTKAWASSRPRGGPSRSFDPLAPLLPDHDLVAARRAVRPTPTLDRCRAISTFGTVR
jgi:hypothetical protein